ncbi:S41 family peptidase [Dyella agri]|uniref:S41 family peptidase n=1 Tax=Dyella agri TaxID=1926869 RepID=A0ABW8KIU6_9GAMM
MSAQSLPGPPAQPDMVVDSAMRQQVVGMLAADLERYYVFPDKAKQYAAALRAKQQQGAYDAVSSADQFAKRLTADLQAVSQDRHLAVEYSADALPPERTSDEPSAEEKAEMLSIGRRLNFGIETVGRLPFNIGYVDLHAFLPAEQVRSRYAAMMTLLGDTRALIIDLRKNDGGDPDAVALLASYLFDKRTRLNDIYSRIDDRTHEMWTQVRLDGPRYGGTREIYLLTSSKTFSGGEDFSYALKNLKRATLVGETTGGGAHPGMPHTLSEHFAVFIPFGRSISPITHTDWEGTGVIPDIAVPADKALATAQQRLLSAFLATEKDPGKREALNKRLHELD